MAAAETAYVGSRCRRPAPTAEASAYPGTCARPRAGRGPGSRAARAARAVASERFVDLPSRRAASSGRRSSAAICWCAIATATGPISSPRRSDDLVQGVTLVIRGDDLLASTGRQIAAGAAARPRRAAPGFLHHPLIAKSPHHAEAEQSPTATPGSANCAREAGRRRRVIERRCRRCHEELEYTKNTTEIHERILEISCLSLFVCFVAL